jgi:hypothetical protein
LVTYATSYKETADSLVSLHGSTSDTVEATAYSIVFLYRHYIERELKSIVALACVLWTVTDNDDNAHQRIRAKIGTHNLKTLVKDCRTACESTGILSNHEFEATFGAYEACILEMAAHDPGSFSFRYPLDKQLTYNSPQLSGIDLIHLKAVIQKITWLSHVIRHAVQQELNWIDSDHWSEDEETMHYKDITGLDEMEASEETQED